MRIALISDIHANMAALRAVIKDARDQGVDAFFCLGDIVGYGPEPLETIDLVREVCDPAHIIIGNHENMVMHPQPNNPLQRPRKDHIWIAKLLKPGMMDMFGGKKKATWDWLHKLPHSFSDKEGDVLYTHASPRNHLEEYILEELTRGVAMNGENAEEVLTKNFEQVKHTCFVGHTHRPGVVANDNLKKFHVPDKMASKWTIDDRKTIINIGSVGQPRDGDNRACYVIWDFNTVQWRRVAYDFETTRKLILANSELDKNYAERLPIGK